MNAQDASFERSLMKRTDLNGADLSRANMKNANLFRARLVDTNLSDAKGLTQEQLNDACGSAGTKLPKGLTIKPCEP